MFLKARNRLNALCACEPLLKDEHAISAALATAGIMPERYSSIFAACSSISTNEITSLIQRVELRKEKIGLTVCLLPILKANGQVTQQVSITQDVPMLMKRRGIETRLIIGNQQDHEPCIDNTLIKAIAKARCWAEELISGKVSSLSVIASREGISGAHVSYMMNLAFLAPSIIEAIIAGQQPADVTSESLMKRTDLPLAWSEQEKLLGIRQTHR